MSMEDKDYTKASARWLFEMSFLNNDYVKTALYANIFNASKFIADVEVLADQYNRRMLIYLKLTFWGEFLKRRKSVSTKVIDIISDALPTYELRVIYDRGLFEKAVHLMSPPVDETSQEESETKNEEEA